MNVTNNNLQSTIVLPTTEAPQFSVVENQVIPLAKARPMPTYPNGTNDHWPDQGLNRLLAKAENFDTNDISEIECLEMLFYLTSKRQDARQLAEAAIETYGSLGRVFDRPGRELRELLGFDYSMTAMLAITKTSMKFILTPKVTARRELGSYAALMDYLALDLRNAEQEIFRIIYLDTKNKIIRDEEMARGTVDAVSIYPKEVAKKSRWLLRIVCHLGA